MPLGSPTLGEESSLCVHVLESLSKVSFINLRVMLCKYALISDLHRKCHFPCVSPIPVFPRPEPAWLVRCAAAVSCSQPGCPAQAAQGARAPRLGPARSAAAPTRSLRCTLCAGRRCEPCPTACAAPRRTGSCVPHSTPAAASARQGCAGSLPPRGAAGTAESIPQDGQQ